MASRTRIGRLGGDERRSLWRPRNEFEPRSPRTASPPGQKFSATPVQSRWSMVGLKIVAIYEL
ncbi:hypothetical protein [Lyngbya sp. CCY1209]|uniref:hypothetical protein n=1 Tax=Lyngbya sp. CCY1209 TaxID=2886103 RepID=UPI002D20AAE7|nr:hypothetical protein [Lyngbya sp. CCY1209]MEB3882276.1 hypothetical protein [Lyngbya sp. CCY1209]